MLNNHQTGASNFLLLMSSLNRHRLTPMNKRSSEENNPNIFLLVLAYYLYLVYIVLHVWTIALFGTETNLISCLNNRVNKPASYIVK